jgi:SAM-dependent methyltransferase
MARPVVHSPGYEEVIVGAGGNGRSPPGFIGYERAVWGRETVAPEGRTIAAFRLAEAVRCLPAGARVVEFGCGAGRMLDALAATRPDLRLAGLDVSRRALDLAAARLPGVDLRHCEGPRSPLPAGEGEFDAALGLDVLEHVVDPPFALAELHRILVPGGALHLHVPCEGDPLALWRWLPARAHAWKRSLAGHVQRFRRAQLMAILAESGFAVERIRYSLHIAGNLVDVVTFAGLALRSRMGGDRRLTTGDLLARGEPSERGAHTRGSAAVRWVDGLLWLEARALARVPSWCVHVTARKVPGASARSRLRLPSMRVGKRWRCRVAEMNL